MKLLRILLTLLALALALVAVLAIVAFIPAVQTWGARTLLASLPGLQGSIGSVTAGFGQVDLEDLHLEREGASLTLPSLEARLPLATAALRRKCFVQSLVAKGWTLDLSRGPRTAASPAGDVTAPAGPVSPKDIALLVGAILSAWDLPADTSVDGVDLEGDVLVVAARGSPPARVHVTVTGGGLAAGRTGSFAYAADGAAALTGSPELGLSVHGTVDATMDTPRRVNRIEVKSDISANGGPLSGDVTVSTDLTATRGAGEVTYTLDLVRGGRHVATLLARLPAAASRISGTWKVDIRDSDAALLLPGNALPTVALQGDGQFDADIPYSRVHAVGRLRAAASRLDALGPRLDRLGAVTLESSFGIAFAGNSVHVDSLSVSVSGERPAALVRSVQSFDVDPRSGVIAVSDPDMDWVQVSVQALPLSWLSVFPVPLTFEGGDAAGEFTVRYANGAFVLRSQAPLVSTGVSVKGSAGTLASGLNLSLGLSAGYGAAGWDLQAAPLLIGRGVRPLATIEAKASRSAGSDQPTSVAGSWSANLGALASRPGTPDAAWIAGRTVTGDFTATVGAATKAELNVSLAGSDAGHSLSAAISADVDPDGSVSFLAPVRIGAGATAAEVTLEGTWTGSIDARISSKDVSLSDLRELAGPLAAAGGTSLGSAAGTRDRVPFWGDWVGRVAIAFDHLRTTGMDFSDVAGTFDLDPASIHLEGGRGGIPGHSVTNGEGSVTFDAAADLPYALKGSAGAFDIDAAAAFASKKRGEDPLVEGHFTVVCTLEGSGANLDDLADRSHEEFRMTSSSGIVRFLHADVAESIPEAATPVKDTIGSVGSLVGTVLGVKGDVLDTGSNKVSRNAEAILNFTNQVSEIGFDKAVVTAVRDADGAVRLLDLEMTSAEVQLKGTGRIASAAGLPLSRRPLGVDLQLAFRGTPADLLSQAGLLSPGKEGDGYSLLGQGVHFAGTLENIDVSSWTELLAKAALKKPAPDKKGG